MICAIREEKKINTIKNDTLFTYAPPRSNEFLILKPEDLKKIYTLLHNFHTEITIEISCDDYTRQELQSIDDLIHYENPPAKEINGLYFRVYAPFPEKKECFLDIENDLEKNFRLYIKGQKKDVNQLRIDIEDHLCGIRTSRLYKLIIGKVHVLFFIITISIYCWITLFFRKKILLYIANLHNISSLPDWQISIIKFIVTILIMIIVYGIMMFCLMLVTKPLFHITRKCFPVVTFAIGQGKKRYENRKKYIYIVFAVVIVPIIIGYLIKLM